MESYSHSTNVFENDSIPLFPNGDGVNGLLIPMRVGLLTIAIVVSRTLGLRGSLRPGDPHLGFEMAIIIGSEAEVMDCGAAPCPRAGYLSSSSLWRSLETVRAESVLLWGLGSVEISSPMFSVLFMEGS